MSKMQKFSSAMVIGLLLMFTASYMDSLRGPLLPILKENLHIDQSQVSLFLVVGHLAALTSTLLLLYFMNIASESFLLKVMLCVSGSLILLVILPPSMPWFYMLGACFGFSNTSLGTFSNIWVLRVAKPQSEAKVMSGLHMLYGLGSLVATGGIGLFLDAGISWKAAVLVVAIFLIAIFVLVSSHAKINVHQPIEIHATKLGKLQIVFLALFGTYVASEVTTSMWMSNYLHTVQEQSYEEAAFATSAFFLVMTLSRALCSLIAVPRLQLILLWSGILIPIVCHTLGHLGYWWAFCLAGMYGPFYPLLMSRAKRSFPHQWRSVATWVVFAIQMTLACIHLSVGSISDHFGLKYAYLIPLFTCAMLIPLLWYFLKLEKER